ncbi:hypothetical protein KP509_01G059100 [Ceratopteris richardii]|uniref:Leucine-rich repeat-containing N-terminal plant-type domain-containing protein n=1 Tax=Ceratopteris richardii TaxID=49495 RepID=A0A8T2VDC7_CERRI|nr:hypothetical protein KP509_01G059100 [Ceratopteris richardii]
MPCRRHFLHAANTLSEKQRRGSPASSSVLLVLMKLLPLYIVFVVESAHAVTDPNDVLALMQIKASIDPATIPATSCLGSWDFSADPCQSRNGERFTCGIECMLASASQNATPTGEYERVISLKFDIAGYAGVLSPWLGNLTELRLLQIPGNALAGEIPITIGKLSLLTALDLSSNSFTGPIPDSIAWLMNLQSLNVAHNKLSGSIPPTMNSLRYLTDLRLQGNLLNGGFPDIRNLGLLGVIDASDNKLSGPFPRQLPPSIYSLSLRNNELGGKLPTNIILKLNQLNILDLSNNTFSGCVNDGILGHPSLQQLNLSMNRLSQLRVHPRHVRQSPMTALDLSYNLLSGPLPSFFALMNQLSSLSLQYNSFHGAIPQLYGAKVTEDMPYMKPFERLILDGNYLTGPLPLPFTEEGSSVHSVAATSLGDNCFQSCPRKFTFCQGKQQKTETLCRLFNASP